MKNLETYHFTFCPLFFSQIHENQKTKSNFVFILSKVHVTKKKETKQTKQVLLPDSCFRGEDFPI